VLKWAQPVLPAGPARYRCETAAAGSL